MWIFFLFEPDISNAPGSTIDAPYVANPSHPGPSFSNIYARRTMPRLLQGQLQLAVS